MRLHNLILNPELERWTAGAPDNYVDGLVNTNRRQLDKTVDRDHPWRVRTVVGPGDDFVLNGRFAYRAEIAAAAAPLDWVLRSAVAGTYPYEAKPNQRWGIKFTCRNSVPGNLLRMRVIGTDADAALVWYLSQVPTTFPHNWTLVASDIDFPMMEGWAEYGVSFITHDVRAFEWEIFNGSAGAQNIDVGRCVLRSPVDVTVGG